MLKRPIKLTENIGDTFGLNPCIEEIELDEHEMLEFGIKTDDDDVRYVNPSIITDTEFLIYILEQCLKEIQ